MTPARTTEPTPTNGRVNVVRERTTKRAMDGRSCGVGDDCLIVLLSEFCGFWRRIACVRRSPIKCLGPEKIKLS